MCPANATKIYSLRAEDQGSIEILLAALRGHFDKPVLRVHINAACPPTKGWPDIHLEFSVPLALEEIQRELAHIRNSDIMFETLRPVPLAKNSLMRSMLANPYRQNNLMYIFSLKADSMTDADRLMRALREHCPHNSVKERKKDSIMLPFHDVALEFEAPLNMQQMYKLLASLPNSDGMFETVLNCELRYNSLTRNGRRNPFSEG